MKFRLHLTERMAFAYGAVILLLSVSCRAADITSAQARTAVDNWLRREAAPLDAKLGGMALEATTYRNNAGDPLFHAVPLKGGGFVVTSADDGINPVIAFSEGNNLAADAGNPLWALLNKDLSQRRAALLAFRASPAGKRPLALSIQGSPEKEWASLLDERQAQPQGLTSVSDVRVSPIVQSHWGQSTVSGLLGNYNCYNYYTPNNYPCGCVATAMAQIMRKHCFPTSSVPAQTFTCSVSGTAKSLTMLGGVYSWSPMVLLPDEGGDTAPSTTIRSAIGKLCYDSGVSVGMQYGSTSSGVNSSSGVPGALVNVFGYASACYFNIGWFGGEDEIRNAVLANLDHGYPVYLGISGEPGRHAVVADGYGFNSGARYIHLNMGWNLNGNGGYQNAWYNVPLVDTAAGVYTALDEVVYNIFPDSEKMLVSGRVLSFSGTPATNVTVLVRDFWTGQICRTLKTNSKGIYTLSWNGSEISSMSVGIFTTNGLYASSEVAVTADLSSDYWVGNVWGADLCLSEPVSYAVKLDANGGSGGSASVMVRVGTGLPQALVAPSRLGFAFLGYFDTPENDYGTQYFDALMNPSGIWHDASIKVLYAHWQGVAVQVGDVFVPYSWLDWFHLAGDHEYAALRDQDGDGQLAWQEYVAGTEPTNRNSTLRALIAVSNGHPHVAWTPDLGTARVYTVQGKTNLLDAAWGPTNGGSRFFKVKVDMP